MDYPAPVSRLIDELRKLPGIGPKSAQRIVFHLMRGSRDDATRLSEAVGTLLDGIRTCARCHAITDQEVCAICSNPGRSGTILCVVEEPHDLLAIERTRDFKGRYHVLHGALSPLQGIGPDELRLSSLLERVREGGVDEVILVPVYAASEAPVKGGRSEDLYARFCRTRPPDTVRLAHSLQEAWRLLTDCVETGDLVLIVGAGDVVSLAERARREWAVSTPATIRGLNRDDSEAIVQTPASEKEPAVAALPRKDGTASSPPLAVEIRPDRERES